MIKLTNMVVEHFINGLFRASTCKSLWENLGVKIHFDVVYIGLYRPDMMIVAMIID